MKKGFTLIELIAVLAILSIIIVISVPQLIGMINESKENTRERIYKLIASSARMYANDYKLGESEPILISTLCEEEYLDCPIKDPITDEEITGYIFSLVNEKLIIEYKHYTGTPISLYQTLIDTVNGKDIGTNKYAGNGLYKWGDKYIYRGGLTKTGTLDSSTGYQSDTDTGSEVNNYIKVSWEDYSTYTNCTDVDNNKCYRIIGINEDGSITIVRDKNLINQRFDNTINTYARINFSNYSDTYGYNDLLDNSYTEYPNEYRTPSEMYTYLYGTNGYENTVIKPYSSILQPLDVCLNKVDEYAGVNNTGYTTTGRVKDTCNIIGKDKTKAVSSLKNKYIRLPYIEEYLNATLEDTCTQDGQYQCRNKNFLYQKQSYWSLNGHTTNSWSVRNVNINGYASGNGAYYSLGVRPVVVLKSSVIISGGTGTVSNPYVLMG